MRLETGREAHGAHADKAGGRALSFVAAFSPTGGRRARRCEHTGPAEAFGTGKLYPASHPPHLPSFKN